jgi:hypothetical protein
MPASGVVVQRIVLLLGLAAGLALGFIDSRPSWDDTGVTAGAILLVTLLLAAMAPQRPWAIALAVGVWIPLFGILNGANYGSLLALAVAFAGAYAGALLRRTVLPA